MVALVDAYHEREAKRPKLVAEANWSHYRRKVLRIESDLLYVTQPSWHSQQKSELAAFSEWRTGLGADTSSPGIRAVRRARELSSARIFSELLARTSPSTAKPLLRRCALSSRRSTWRSWPSSCPRNSRSSGSWAS